MGYSNVTIEQPRDWVLIFYMAFSFVLMLILLIVKRKDMYPNAICKVLGFVIIFVLGGVQYLFFRFGMSPLYDLIDSIPNDSLPMRMSAFFFMLSYFYCLPFKNIK